MRLPPPTASPDITTIVETEAKKWRTVEVEFIDPEDYSEDRPYDPETDTGGERVYPVIWPLHGNAALARIVALGASDSSTPEEWGTKRNFQIDIALEEGLPLFRKGIVIRPAGGGDDPALWSFSYTVRSAVDSSIASQRTILAVSELGISG